MIQAERTLKAYDKRSDTALIELSTGEYRVEHHGEDILTTTYLDKAAELYHKVVEFHIKIRTPNP